VDPQIPHSMPYEDPIVNRDATTCGYAAGA